jgi:MFS family permease
MSNAKQENDPVLFWGCFIALVTCAFGFVVRTQVIGEWADQFSMSETEKGEILGVGFWPFAFGIFFFSMFIDKIGYKTVAIFGWICHIVSTYILYTADSVSQLYWGTFIFALSNGTVEAYINPVVAAVNTKEKGKWLNILHAGWPGGIVLAGLIAMSLGDAVSWQNKVALTIIPTIIYGIMLAKKKFPISERVAAGISDRDMLKDFGGAGAFVSIFLIGMQAIPLLGYGGNVYVASLVSAAVAGVAFGSYVKGWGHPIFIILILVMMPLATTELGIDSWITEIMKGDLGENAGYVLLYTAAIMTILRFYAGPVLNFFGNNPFKLLSVSAAFAIAGLVCLSNASGFAFIFFAATLYGLGKTFFWPTMLAAVNEQCPRGGAMTLNCIGGVGMLSLSIGGVFLGNIQDKKTEAELTSFDEANGTTMVSTYMEEKDGLLGKYKSLDAKQKGPLDNKILLFEANKKVADANGSKESQDSLNASIRNVFRALPPTKPDDNASEADKKAFATASEDWNKNLVSGDIANQTEYLKGKDLFIDQATYDSSKSDQTILDNALHAAKKNALFTAAIFPVIMLVVYLGFLKHFTGKGGYKPVELDAKPSSDKSSDDDNDESDDSKEGDN